MATYTVQFRSSGIIAARFSERAMAMHWLQCNDFDPETGNCLNLFKIVRMKNNG